VGITPPLARALAPGMERWERIEAAVGIALPRSGCCQCDWFASVGTARTAVEITQPRVGYCGARRTAAGIGSLAMPRQFRRCCYRTSRPRLHVPQCEDSRWTQPRLGAHFGMGRVYCREWGEETKKRRRRLTGLQRQVGHRKRRTYKVTVGKSE